MNRYALIISLSLLWAQATLTATTTYSNGVNNNISFASTNNPSDNTAYHKGDWTEVFTGGAGTSEQIVCTVALATVVDTCGNPGPGSSQHIPIWAAPGSTGNLPGGTTNYVQVDGDPAWGAPVWTNMTGLTNGAIYQVSFYQGSSEETNGNNKAYNDNFKVYLIPGAASGQYICPVCVSPVDPIPGDLAYTSAVMANPGGASTPWTLQTFTFTAGGTSEILEFVTNAVAVTAGAWEPPMLDLTAVSLTFQSAPEPGTWAMMLMGAGLIFVGRRFRR